MMNNPLADSLRANRKSEPRTTNMKEKASVDVRVDVVHGSSQNIDRPLLLLLSSHVLDLVRLSRLPAFHKLLWLCHTRLDSFAI
jgi:hypothetical protein